MSDWYFVKDGQSTGPINDEQIRSLIASGAISPNTQVWKEGMAEWAEVQATELKSSLVSRPRLSAPSVAPAPPAIAAPASLRSPPPNFESPTTLATIVKILMIVGLVLCFASIGIGVMEHMKLKQGIDTSEEELGTGDLVVALIGLFQMVVFLSTAVFFLMWVYRVNKNARALGADWMTFTPGWSVGWFFIPFANLWKPYQAMKEIWQASFSPTRQDESVSVSILSAWWTLWLLSNILAQTSIRLTFRAKEISEHMIANYVSLSSDLLDIPLTFVAILMITRLTRAQMSHVQGGTANAPA